MMKVQVQITNSNKAAANSTTLDITVGPGDTVFKVQELIASTTKTLSFPDQKLLLNGQLLPSSKRLSDCGITEGAMLEFVFQASEKTLINQLSELLGKQAMSVQELGFLYSYRYSASFEESLKAAGNTKEQLRSFLESQKCFSLHGDQVKLVEAVELVQKPSSSLTCIKEDKVSGVLAVSINVVARVAGKSPEAVSFDDEDEDVHMHLEASDTVARSKEIIAASEQMPFPDRDLWMGEQRLEDEVTLHEAGVKDGAALVMVVHASESSLASQLEQLLWESAGLSPGELSLRYCQRFGTPVGQALRTLGLHSNLGRFLEGHSQFTITGGCVALTNGPKLAVPLSEQEKADALEAVDYVIDLLCDASFLSIDHVDKECCVAREAKATVFVNGLPPSQEAALVQGLQKAVASTLEAQGNSARVCGDLVEVKVEGSQTISLRLAAACSRFQ